MRSSSNFNGGGCNNFKTSLIFIAVAFLAIIFENVVEIEGSLSVKRGNTRKWRKQEEFQQERNSTGGAYRGHNRDGKFFPLLSFVTLPQSTCTTDGGGIGVCMKNSRCQRAGGVSSGSCGNSFGVCCVINKVCTGNGNIDTVTVNGTHLVQPAMPTELCRYEIPRQDGVCQIRLDFIEFNIDQGEDAKTFGECNSDTFTISGQANPFGGPLCGDLRGQHMYLEYSSDKINLDFFLQSQMSQKWDISVTMIRCDSLERAPAGCLQYYTTQTGIVKSFNYNNMVQLNNQDYTVCVRAQVGMRKITWKPCMTNPKMTTDFIISGGPPAVDPNNGPVVGQGFSGDNCELDWVMILGQNKYCGSQFPPTVTATSQPFIMQVHFNQFELPPPPPCPPPDVLDPMYACPGNPDDNPGPLPDVYNTGFCLRYSQSPAY